MKKLSILLFYAIISANGLFAMFSSENNGCFPEEGFRFKNRTVRYNKNLRLVIPKECQEQELYNWVAITNELPDDDNYNLALERESDSFKKKYLEVSLVRYCEDRNVIFAKEKVTKKKIIDPNLLDNEGNLIIAKWFASKGLNFTEPQFEEKTIIPEQTFKSFNDSAYIREHKYNDEYNYYIPEKRKAENKQNIHSYINNMHLQQGIWTYLRSMRIIEWLLGESAQKIKNIVKFSSTYQHPLNTQWAQEVSELKNLLECTESMLQQVENKLGNATHQNPIKLFEEASNFVKNQLELFENNLSEDEMEARKERSSFKERLEGQKELLTKEIESLIESLEENDLSFVQSVMKRSEFNMYQKFRLAIERE